MTAPRQPVTPDDLRAAARLCTGTLRPALDEDWSITAHGLEWSCRHTLDHISDALAYFATNMGAAPPLSPYGQYGERAAAPIADLLASVEPLADLVAVTSAGLQPETRIPHMWGETDPEGILAMGVVELLVHTWDIAYGFPGSQMDYLLEDDLASRVVPRLFPDNPGWFPSRYVLGYETGRISLGRLPRKTSWRWHSGPLTDR